MKLTITLGMAFLFFASTAAQAGRPTTFQKSESSTNSTENGNHSSTQYGLSKWATLEDTDPKLEIKNTCRRSAYQPFTFVPYGPFLGCSFGPSTYSSYSSYTGYSSCSRSYNNCGDPCNSCRSYRSYGHYRPVTRIYTDWVWEPSSYCCRPYRTTCDISIH